MISDSVYNSETEFVFRSVPGDWDFHTFPGGSVFIIVHRATRRSFCFFLSLGVRRLVFTECGNPLIEYFPLDGWFCGKLLSALEIFP